MSKALMPKWFVPALVVSGTLAVVSGLRMVKDKRLFGGEEASVVDDEEEWETVAASEASPDEDWMNETIWESPTGDGLT
jgi:hypothetical protein